MIAPNVEAPTVVHHERVVTEYAVLCQNGTVHVGAVSYRSTAEDRARDADGRSASGAEPHHCTGSPHHVAERRRITTPWKRIEQT